MVEPQWGVELLQTMNTFISSKELYYNIAAVLADYPIFLIPIFLIITYVYRGIVKKYGQAKYGALLIFIVAVIAAAINLGLQELIIKARPETALLSAGRLVMKHLPTASFPSDHAAVAMAVALATLIRGYSRGKKKNIIVRGWILFIGAVVMSIARVAVGVHWPTDILAGWGVAVVATLIVFFGPVQRFLETYIARYIIQFEECLLGKCGVYKK